MPLITEIPCELVASILRSLDDLRSLTSALMSCRHIYTSFKQSHGIKSSVILRQITPELLPYSVSVIEAARLSHPRDPDSVRELLDALYSEPGAFTARLSSLPISLLHQMSHTQEVIQSLATGFASEAWTRLYQDDSNSASTAVTLSPEENFRFCRAFYRVELFYSLFRGNTDEVASPFEETMNDWFFSQHPPWENEQLGCAHDFLEAKLAEASYNILAHDIYFGEMSIDYLTSGELNISRQIWLSQGVNFLHRLINENTDHAKQDLLMSSNSIGWANLPGALANALDAFSEEEVVLEDHTREQIVSGLPCHSSGDGIDEGPYEAWYAAHKHLPKGAWFMLDHNGWLRDRAYVFWDWDRIQKHHLLEIFQSDSDQGDQRHNPTSEEFEEMQESFDERSKIWQKGGKGYWSKGDTSRIEWPGNS